MEKELCEYLLEMEARLAGLTREDVRFVAFQMAKLNNVQNPFAGDSEMAG